MIHCIKSKEYKPDELEVEGHSEQVGQLMLVGVHCGEGRMLG